jgi:hypothetical protein
MEPRVILIKPASLAALPTYAKALRGTRVLMFTMPAYPILLAALMLYGGVYPVGVAIGLLLVLAGVSSFIRSIRRSQARLVAIMAGDEPLVVAHDVDGAYELRPGNPRHMGVGLPVAAGDVVTVSVERARDLRKGKRTLGFMEWRFGNRDAAPLVIGTYFDPDAALLRDVEKRLKGLGVTVEVSHTSFDGVPAP